MNKERNFYKLTLAMIVKNDADKLSTLWASVKNIVDEWIVVDTGSTDSTVETVKKLGKDKVRVIEAGNRFNLPVTQEFIEFCGKYNVEVKEDEKVFHFGNARNESFSHATGDFILWLDSDDILIGSEKLRRIIESNLDPRKQLGLHMLYKYELDEYRNPIIEHYRERVLPNNGTCKWSGRIHEIIIPTVETEYIRIEEGDSHVLHNPTEGHKISSGRRNTKSLLLDLFEQGNERDPRTLFFLAESLKVEGNSDRARELFEEYLTLSGWDEERCLAAIRLVNHYIVRGDFHKALEWGFKAIKERPDFPGGYSAVAQAYYGLDEYAFSEKYARLAVDTDQPETVVMVDQKYNRFIPLYILAEMFVRSGKIKNGLSIVKEAMKFEPLNENLLKLQYTCEKILREEEIVGAIGKLTEYLKDEGELKKAALVTENVPSSLSEDPRVAQIADVLKGEIVKRMNAPKRVRLEAGKEVGVQYRLLEADLKKFKCKSVLVIGEEELLAGWLKGLGFEVKFAKPNSPIIDDYDAIFFDYCLQYQSDELYMKEIEKNASKLIALCVPNRDPNAIIQCTVGTVEGWFDFLERRSWNIMPLGNGVIYGSSIVDNRGKSKVTFFCGGDSTEEWGPFSHVNGGCGGSEEATIYLGRGLAERGHKVEVLNSYPHTCYVEGVKWRNVSTLKGSERFETLVLWRIPHFIEQYSLKADRMYLWLHDVPQREWFTEKRVSQIDGFIVLSKYHRSLLPEGIDETKIFYSQNGVDLRQFEQEVERDPKKVIYTSSYDRGLEHLLEIWKEVIEVVPDAKLKIAYGWGTYDKLRTDPKHREWKSKMMELMTQKGVEEVGRIDQVSLARELLGAGVFAYPCHFEEISCISAMKAQVAGCIPLTTNYAALAETNLFEGKVSGNPREDEGVRKVFKEKLIEVLKNPPSDDERIQIAAKAWKKFSWESIAKSWSEKFEGAKK